MSSRYTIAALLAGSLVAAPAFAQTPAPKGSASQPPAAGQPAAGQPGQARAAQQPLAAPSPGQMLGSDLEGTSVYGANNENIGDISDVVIDREGRVVAVIVGVGGFLGIGEKDVAVPFRALEITAAAPAAGTGAAGMTGMTGTTGTAASQGTGTTASQGTGTAASRGTVNPDRIVLRGMTRADLENAPEFRSEGRAGTTTGAAGQPGGGAMSPAGTRPQGGAAQPGTGTPAR